MRRSARAALSVSLSHSLGHAGGSRELSRLAPLLDSMELRIRSVSRRARATHRIHCRNSWNMRRLGKQLQSDVWQARMVPAESLLEGYRKMMRDLARDEGKEIEFRANSAGVRADRRVLEALKDPIMHLLRNAVSHGIESPSERTAKGKRRSGLVAFGVDANGQRLTITLQDDGRGVDLARVVEVAIRDGILSESDAAHRSPQELTRILFRPGFSTSAAVTRLAGRGMGLSVAYEAVRRLQGDLDVQPAPGGGTIIHLSVPQSIATHRLIVVSCGSQVFVIPILGIERLKRIKLSSVETVEGKQVVVLDGQPVPLASIQGLLGLEYSSATEATRTLANRHRALRSRRVALAVDAVLRETDAVIQDLGSAAGCDGKISSGVVLDDGAIGFVVNPMELIESAVQVRYCQCNLCRSQSRAEPPPITAPRLFHSCGGRFHDHPGAGKKHSGSPWLQGPRRRGRRGGVDSFTAGSG